MAEPSAVPTRKVGASGVAGAVAFIIVYVVNKVTGEQLPPGMESAITAIVMFVAGYLTPNRTPQEEP